MTILLCAHSRASTKEPRPASLILSEVVSSVLSPDLLPCVSEAAEVPYTIGWMSLSVGGVVSGIVACRAGPVKGLTCTVETM